MRPRAAPRAQIPLPPGFRSASRAEKRGLLPGICLILASWEREEQAHSLSRDRLRYSLCP
jgi:hypothetical protein